MIDREISLELLVGRAVLTKDGGRLGRIEEIKANDNAEVTEFLVGKQAFLERLSALGLFYRKKSGYRIRWDQIDLSDPLAPTLTCQVTDLEHL
jgi:sporulation protein YlmC with PRC-barrel domain